MAEESFSDSERTEQATPKRREEARRKGQIAKSREIPSVLILLGGMSTLFLFWGGVSQQISSLMVRFFNQMGTFSIEPDTLSELNGELIRSVLYLLAPFLGILLVLSVAGHLAQSGLLVAGERIKPDPSKLNPLKGFGRLVSKQSWMELFKALFKVTLIGWVAWHAIRKEWLQILLLSSQEVGQISHYLRSVAWDLLFQTSLVLAALAGLDYFFQRWSHEKRLRMTKQELKEEARTTEGDPLVKSRIRSIQRQMARKRMMAEVPKADVIITNPTHLAVALCYKSKEMEAPKVVAKGAGEIAERIKTIGRDHQVPIVENKPLAQILYKTVELGQVIPSTLYQVVADVLAYVYRLKNRTL
jgi:flagellar biosynthetic protein FlhB